MEIQLIEKGEPTTLAVLTAFAEAVGADMGHVTALLAADSPMNTMIQSMVQVIRTRFDQFWDPSQRTLQ